VCCQQERDAFTYSRPPLTAHSCMHAIFTLTFVSLRTYQATLVPSVPSCFTLTFVSFMTHTRQRWCPLFHSVPSCSIMFHTHIRFFTNIPGNAGALCSTPLHPVPLCSILFHTHINDTHQATLVPSRGAWKSRRTTVPCGQSCGTCPTSPTALSLTGTAATTRGTPKVEDWSS
jgi:hypothetical protein